MTKKRSVINNIFNPSAIIIIAIIMVSIVSYEYLTLDGINTNNIKEIGVGAFMSILLLTGLGILSALFLFGKGGLLSGNPSWEESAISYFYGGVACLVIRYLSTISQMSFLEVFSLPTLSLFSSTEVQSSIPDFWNTLIVTVGASVTEELIWTMCMPALYFLFISVFVSTYSNRYPTVSKILNNFWVQFIPLIIILDLSFAYFHIGMQSSSIFLISAMVFRTLIAYTVVGDWRKDTIPMVKIYAPFAFAFHKMNNIIEMFGGYGLIGAITHWLAVLLPNPLVYPVEFMIGSIPVFFMIFTWSTGLLYFTKKIFG